MRADLEGLLGKAYESAKFESPLSRQLPALMIRHLSMIPLDTHYFFYDMLFTQLCKVSLANRAKLVIWSKSTGLPSHLLGVSRVRVSFDISMLNSCVLSIVRLIDADTTWTYYEGARVFSSEILCTLTRLTTEDLLTTRCLPTVLPESLQLHHPNVCHLLEPEDDSSLPKHHLPFRQIDRTTRDSRHGR